MVFKTWRKILNYITLKWPILLNWVLKTLYWRVKELIFSNKKWKGSAQWRDHKTRVGQNEERAGAIRARPRGLRHHTRSGLSRVLGQDERRRSRGLRDGHARRSTDQPQEEEEVLHPLKHPRHNPIIFFFVVLFVVVVDLKIMCFIIIITS